MSKYTWKDEVVDIGLLQPVEYNPRKTNKKAKKKYEENYAKFGMLDIIVVNNDYRIIGGHQKYYSAVERGDKTIEISRCETQMSEADEKALNIKLNSITGFTVMESLTEFGYTKEDLENIGFREFKMPEIKLDDVAVVVKDKEKNKSVIALFYETDDLIKVRSCLKEIIKNEDDIINSSDAVKFLAKHYG